MALHSSIDHTGLTGVGSTISYASNSNQVAAANAAGASTLVSRADHVHLGVTSISHTSNTFSGPVILTASGATGITSPTPGTYNISSTAGTGGGGAATTTWATWTPTVTQSGSVSATVTHASYAVIGNATLFRCSLTMTATGTGNNPIVIGGQPASLQDSQAATGATTIIGSGIVRDEGTAYYMCNVIAYAAQAWRLITYNSTGYAGQDPNFALASGDTITLVGTVRTA